MDFDRHFVILRHGVFYLFEPKDIGRTIVGVYDRFNDNSSQLIG